eukprot:gene2935-3659_t
MTKADLLSQQHIIGGLKNRWENLIIVGEESCEIPQSNVIPKIDLLNGYDTSNLPSEYKSLNINDVIVFIDPLDATREFTMGRVHCVMTLIGVSYKGKPIGGVIYQPFVDDKGEPTTDSEKWCGRLVWGIPGLPVDTVSSKRSKEDEGKVIVTTSALHANEKVEKSIEKIRPDKIIRTGGAGYKILLIIENLADVYIFPTVGSKLWDICGPHAILTACDGTLTDPLGNDIVYSTDPSKIENKLGIVISRGNRDRHNHFINLINQ